MSNWHNGFKTMRNYAAGGIVPTGYGPSIDRFTGEPVNFDVGGSVGGLDSLLKPAEVANISPQPSNNQPINFDGWAGKAPTLTEEQWNAPIRDFGQVLPVGVGARKPTPNLFTGIDPTKAPRDPFKSGPIVDEGYNPFDDPGFTGDSYKKNGKIYFRDGAVMVDDSGMGRGFTSEPVPPRERQPLVYYGPTSVDDSSRGPTPGQPRINPVDPYHPVPPFESQTGGIGSYIDELNKRFQSVPKYNPAGGTTTNNPWTGQPTINPGTSTGGTGGGGGGGGTLEKVIQGAIGAKGVYDNWDNIKDLYYRITGQYLDPNTKLTKKEADEATDKTADAAKLETDASIANAGYIVNPITGLFEGPGVRGGSVTAVDPETGENLLGDKNTTKSGTTQSSTGTVPVDSSLVGAGANLFESGIGALLNKNLPSGSISGFSTTGEQLFGDTDKAIPSASSSVIPGLAPEVASAIAKEIATGAVPSGSISGFSTTGEQLFGNTGSAGTAGAAEAAGTGAANLASVYENALEGLGNFGGLTNAESADLALRASLEGPDLGYASRAGTGATGEGFLSKLTTPQAASFTNPLGLSSLANAGLSTGLGLVANKIMGSGAGGNIGSAIGSLAGPVGTVFGSILGEMLMPTKEPLRISDPLTGQTGVVEGTPYYDAVTRYLTSGSSVPQEMRGMTAGAGMNPGGGMNMQNMLGGEYLTQFLKPVYAAVQPEQNLIDGMKPIEWLAQQYAATGGDTSKIPPEVQAFLQKNQSAASAAGGPINYASGGIASLGTYKAGGLLDGPGDGMSDDIPAVIMGDQPQRAALADGEFVIPADVVSHLGNGSTKSGSQVLYSMMDRVRKARTGNPEQGKRINPDKFMPV